MAKRILYASAETLIALFASFIFLFIINLGDLVLKINVFHRFVELFNYTFPLSILAIFIKFLGKLLKAAGFPINLLYPPVSAIGSIITLYVVLLFINLIGVIFSIYFISIFFSSGLIYLLYLLIFFLAILAGYANIFHDQQKHHISRFEKKLRQSFNQIFPPREDD